MDAFIAHHLAGVSRTYAIVVPMLPPPLDDTVGLAYLVMRIVDTLEDAPQLDSAERRRRLDDLDAALDGDSAAAARLAAPVGGRAAGNPIPDGRPVGDLPAEHALMHDAPEVFRRLAALPPPCRQPIVACARTMRAGVLALADRAASRGLPYPAIRDAAELREYCYYVAGVVGEMLCALMADYLAGAADPNPARECGADRAAGPTPRGVGSDAAARLLTLRDTAVDLGIGLQLVNILKDAPADACHDRRYLPLPGTAPEAGAVIYRDTLATARACLRRGIDYVLALPLDPPGLRAFCGLPVVWGALTLARAAGDPASAKVDRAAIQASIADFECRAGDDTALRTWLSTLLRPSLPEP